MRRRSKIPNRRSRRMFTKSAKFVNRKNALPNSNPMRGGIRL